MNWRNSSFIFCVTVIYCFLVDEIKTNEIPCNAKDNRYWKSSRSKCAECKECPSGKARNYTEEYTRKRGSHGDERCLKCRRCKKGYYVHIPEWGGVLPACVTCSTSCADRNRFTERMCNTYNNWDCGGCLPGYTDDGLSNTDLYCFKPEGKTQTVAISKESNVSSVTRTEMLYSSQHKNVFPADNVLTLVACVGGIMLTFIFIVGILCVLQKKRKGKQNRLNTPIFYSEVGNENDIECDCARENDSGNMIGLKLARYEHSDERVRAEMLSNSRSRGGELSHPVHGTETIDSLREVCHQLSQYTRLNGVGQQVCRCIRRCCDVTCDICGPLCDSVEDVSLMDKTDLLNTISREICHDPSDVFKILGVKDSDIYGLNDNRNRNVDGFSQSEFICSVLKRWVEVNGRGARLHSLIKALCKGRFHTINNKLYQEDLYNFITVQDE